MLILFLIFFKIVLRTTVKNFTAALLILEFCSIHLFEGYILLMDAVSGIMQQLLLNPSPNFSLLEKLAACRKVFFKKYKTWSWKLPILHAFGAKLEFPAPQLIS